MYKLSAVTPEKVVFEKEAISLVAPGLQGYLGVLTDHAPLITPLVPGKLEIKDASGATTEYFISGGFLEVSNNVATILADAIEIPGEIDRIMNRRSVYNCLHYLHMEASSCSRT